AEEYIKGHRFSIFTMGFTSVFGSFSITSG
ncbi:unnamed protein product, partial [marine sediment metagenome]